MTALETQMYHALKALPCRCRMAGGEKWHLRATPEVEHKCSACKAIEEYERQDLANASG